MNNRSNKQLLTKFMQKIWNEGNLSFVEKFVAPQYDISKDE